MPFAVSLKAFRRKLFSTSERSASPQPIRSLTITCRGNHICRDDIFKYTNGRFLANEEKALDRRYVKFDLDRLCTVAASTGQASPVHAIEKLEGGFSKALLLRKEDGSELIAKIPFPIAGPPKYTTASEVAVLQYLHAHTQIPVPKILAWDSDPLNPVGAEYIMMEKAPGVQLFKMWDKMSDWDQLCLVKQLTALEGEMTQIQFPASGSLYLRKSMTENDSYLPLDRGIDPTGQFCIGPSCERGWYAQGKIGSMHARLNSGPWQDLSSFGIALVEREIALLTQKPKTDTDTSLPPRGSLEEQIAVLKLTKEVMSMIKELTFVGKVSRPVLWHTDLHMGNIYVSEENPAEIISIIDWQSIVVSPLFLQARFPEFLPIEEDYELGTQQLPQLPPDYDKMEADDKEYAEYKFKQAKLAKVYELSSGSKNNPAYKALRIPDFLRDLFIRCGEASEEGIIPLRACLIEISKTWDELGFTSRSPIMFSEDDLQTHEKQFKDYRDYHAIHELARKILGTDFEGWIAPQLDFVAKQQQNEELFQEMMRRSAEYNKSPEEIRKIWPYLDSSPNAK